MPRLALWNLLIGFIGVFLGACMGPFIADDMAQAILRDPELLDSWGNKLLMASHGHLSLFGMLQVCLGLTMPYCSRITDRIRFFQTWGISAGLVAMGPLLYAKSLSVPEPDSFLFIDVVIGFCLSLAMLAILIQIYGLAHKLKR